MHANRKNIIEKVEKNLNLFFKDKLDGISANNLSSNDMLRIISSDSVQAINFISLIEDELEIEINDDDINIEFFTNIDNVINAILSVKKSFKNGL